MKFLIVRLSAMGDIIHALPLAANLARAGHSVSWLVESPFSGLLSGNPHLDRLHLAQTRQWRKSPLGAFTRHEMATLREELRSARYDAVLDTMGSFKSHSLARLAGSKTFVLDDRQRRRDVTRLLSDVRIVPPPSSRHVVDIMLSLLAPFGVPVFEARPDALYLAGHATEKSAEFLRHLPARFALYHPGARWTNKAWGAERFAEAARHIEAALGLAPVVSWGPGDEGSAEKLAGLLGAPKLPLLDFPDFAVVICRSALFVAGDTGPLHLADALARPTVAVFGPTASERNGPYGNAQSAVSLSLPCSPCWQRYNAIKPCLSLLDPSLVASRARAIVSNSRGDELR